MYQRQSNLLGPTPPFLPRKSTQFSNLNSNLNFKSVFMFKKTFVATLNETCVLTSRKHVAGHGIIMPSLWHTF